MARVCRSKDIPKGLEHRLTIDVDCPICDSRAPDGTYLRAKALINYGMLANRMLVPEGFLCFICGFKIQPEQIYLAKHFVPPIPQDVTHAFLSDFGIE